MEDDKNSKFQVLLGGLGTASGIFYGFTKKTGFWKGLGITLLFGIAGSSIGYGIDNFNKK